MIRTTGKFSFLILSSFRGKRFAGASAFRRNPLNPVNFMVICHRSLTVMPKVMPKKRPSSAQFFIRKMSRSLFVTCAETRHAGVFFSYKHVPFNRMLNSLAISDLTNSPKYLGLLPLHPPTHNPPRPPLPNPHGPFPNRHLPTRRQAPRLPHVTLQGLHARRLQR